MRRDYADNKEKRKRDEEVADAKKKIKGIMNHPVKNMYGCYALPLRKFEVWRKWAVLKFFVKHVGPALGDALARARERMSYAPGGEGYKAAFESFAVAAAAQQ